MLLETFRLALLTVLRNKLRSFLTVLGIVIGVASVIAMVTVGQGSTAQVQSDVASLGSNLLVLSAGAPGRGPGGGGGPGVAALTLKDSAALEQLPSVTAAAPVVSTSGNAVANGVTWATGVTGSDEKLLTIRGWTLSLGRNFTEAEGLAGSPVCVLGETVRSELFGAGDPIDASIRFDKMACRVVGVLAEREASTFGSDENDMILMPVRTVQRRLIGSPDVPQIYVSVKNGISTDVAKAEIEKLMRERRRIGAGDEDDFNVFDLKQISSMLTGITAVLTGLLSAVAAISLVVGGIGIMNIMLVSVTERTREIGIRMAIGATERQVLMQFLVEAIVLSVIGGILGIIVGLGLGLAGSYALNITFTPDIRVVIASFIFSGVVGVVFGYFPARRAARLDPIEALRHQ
jgi:putative ABC transport system permease protein